VKQNMVLPSCIITGTQALSKHGHHKYSETVIKLIYDIFLIRQECAFQIAGTWTFSSLTIIFLHLACLGGKCYVLGLFLWVGISLTVGPMLCLSNEKAKTLKTY
jgi:hypothetical protein